MTLRAYFFALPLLALLSAGYAFWTQPLFGPESVSSATARALILVGWLGLFPIVLQFRIGHWSWISFLVAFVCGGAWISFIFVSETFEKTLPLIAAGIAYGTVSGLYAATARNLGWAVLIGFVMFLAQFSVDYAAAGFGLSRLTWGM